ncbi:MAG: N-acetylglucosamine-6-phosphate deacetylase [Caldilineaceae bacterium]|nr:N-acetylglucosamine-6-phosphate deacetylase [Caldilineaceae bacterium]
MSRLLIKNGRLPGEFVPWFAGSEDGFQAGHLALEEGRVAGILPDDALPFVPFDSVLDAAGCYVLPGFIDVHVHGGDGHDVMDATPAALAAIGRFKARHGVTGFLPTTMTAPLAAIGAAVRTAKECTPTPADGARMLGVHVEGPYISPEYPGAQPPQDIRQPNVAEFAELVALGPVRLITLAPEQPGGHDLVRAAVDADVVPVIGHTSADYAQAIQAFDLGVRQATHAYNAMTGLHHRRPGALGAVLSDDRVFAQLIADNIHVHPGAMNVLARCKGPERTLLITDAIRATGLPPGEYELGGQAVYVADGACRLADGTLAGSVLTMDRALVNFMRATGWSLAQAWPTTSRTPAVSLGLDRKVGALKKGYAADVVLLNQAYEVEATVVAGDVVYANNATRLSQNPQ